MRHRSCAAILVAIDLFHDTRRTTDGIRVGIGGWTCAPWRDNFYPKGLVQRRELEYASRHVGAIAWAARARLWAADGEPADLPKLEAVPAPAMPREVFVYFISAAKARNPAAAMALMARLAQA